jgi:hypothetical protein
VKGPAWCDRASLRFRLVLSRVEAASPRRGRSGAHRRAPDIGRQACRFSAREPPALDPRWLAFRDPRRPSRARPARFRVVQLGRNDFETTDRRDIRQGRFRSRPSVRTGSYDNASIDHLISAVPTAARTALSVSSWPAFCQMLMVHGTIRRGLIGRCARGLNRDRAPFALRHAAACAAKPPTLTHCPQRPRLRVDRRKLHYPVTDRARSVELK